MSHSIMVVSRASLPADTVTLARWLIGRIVMRNLPAGVVSGRIVETEAYLSGDPAAHSYRGPTPRNRSLFLKRGHAYVYICYGTSFMLNVSAETAGIGTGVLIRALEPLAGVELMRRHRGVERLGDLTRGPGRLAAALQLDLSLDGIDLCRRGPLWLGRDDHVPGPLGTSTRIGITKNVGAPLRFYLKGNPFVSGPKTLNA